MAYDLALRDPTTDAGLVALAFWLPGVLVDTLRKAPERGVPGADHPRHARRRIAVEKARESRESAPYGVA